MDFTAFRSNLTILMESRGYSSNNSLSADLGVPAGTISRWKTGDRAPDLEYVIRLAEFFGVSIDWLLGFEQDRYSSLPQESQNLLNLYALASEDDRAVIKTVLAKYKGV